VELPAGTVTPVGYERVLSVFELVAVSEKYASEMRGYGSSIVSWAVKLVAAVCDRYIGVTGGLIVKSVTPLPLKVYKEVPIDPL
jgi:hypothetical protein